MTTPDVLAALGWPEAFQNAVACIAVAWVFVTIVKEVDL